jgi:hypothetical protein
MAPRSLLSALEGMDGVAARGVRRLIDVTPAGRSGDSKDEMSAALVVAYRLASLAATGRARSRGQSGPVRVVSLGCRR